MGASDSNLIQTGLSKTRSEECGTWNTHRPSGFSCDPKLKNNFHTLISSLPSWALMSFKVEAFSDNDKDNHHKLLVYNPAGYGNQRNKPLIPRSAKRIPRRTLIGLAWIMCLCLNQSLWSKGYWAMTSQGWIIWLSLEQEQDSPSETYEEWLFKIRARILGRKTTPGIHNSKQEKWNQYIHIDGVVFLRMSKYWVQGPELQPVVCTLYLHEGKTPLKTPLFSFTLHTILWTLLFSKYVVTFTTIYQA